MAKNNNILLPLVALVAGYLASGSSNKKLQKDLEDQKKQTEDATKKYQDAVKDAAITKAELDGYKENDSWDGYVEVVDFTATIHSYVGSDGITNVWLWVKVKNTYNKAVRVDFKQLSLSILNHTSIIDGTKVFNTTKKKLTVAANSTTPWICLCADYRGGWFPFASIGRDFLNFYTTNQQHFYPCDATFVFDVYPANATDEDMRLSVDDTDELQREIYGFNAANWDRMDFFKGYSTPYDGMPNNKDIPYSQYLDLLRTYYAMIDRYNQLTDNGKKKYLSELERIQNFQNRLTGQVEDKDLYNLSLENIKSKYRKDAFVALDDTVEPHGSVYNIDMTYSYD